MHDIGVIMRLEQSCATAAHWSEEQYRRAIDRVSDTLERLVLVAEAVGSVNGESAVRGFLAARHVARQWELENIAVSPEFCRQGIGAELLSALLTHARQSKSSLVFLEVRESNVAARRLYEKAGFQQSGRRKLYYSGPAEDAILYSQVIA
jgi:[ribosomal protein S18]-alanine N-acetyltransferase